MTAIGSLQHHEMFDLLPLLLQLVVGQCVAAVAVRLVAAAEPIAVLADARSKGGAAVERRGCRLALACAAAAAVSVVVDIVVAGPRTVHCRDGQQLPVVACQRARNGVVGVRVEGDGRPAG